MQSKINLMELHEIKLIIVYTHIEKLHNRGIVAILHRPKPAYCLFFRKIKYKNRIIFKILRDHKSLSLASALFLQNIKLNNERRKYTLKRGGS